MQSNEHLTSPDRRLALNDCKHWADAGIWDRPSDVDVEKYQKRLNQIVGVSESGQPIVRLKWAWECRDWTTCEWDSFGIATKSEWRARYRFLTVKVGDDYADLSIPRWVLEERYEPGQYESSWEASRWAFDPELGVSKDIAGPLPREGWYKALYDVGIICTHDKDGACCKRLQDLNRQQCWGYYKTPGERELQMLARAVKLRNESGLFSNPHAPLPSEVVQRLHKESIDRVELEAVKKHDLLVDAISSANAPSMINGRQLYDMAYRKQETTGLYVPR